MHDEREMDRVLGIDGVQLIGINNRNLGMLFLFHMFRQVTLAHILYNNVWIQLPV